MTEPPLKLGASARVAYFSMEIALEARIATYAGGLGILAGDLLRSAADLELPLIGVTLVSHSGYFKQVVDAVGRQNELPDAWQADAHMRLLGTKVVVHLERRAVWVGAWLYLVYSHRGSAVPVILLDTNLAENHAEDRTLTDHLYGGNAAYRLKQEAILGIGGVRMLRTLAVHLNCYHMNEGHSALLGLELRRTGEHVRRIFTTHTPVEAGHDKFPYPLVKKILGDYCEEGVLQELAGQDALNMTQLALSLSDYVNGVAPRHASVSQHMFPEYKIRAVINGVHPLTWTCTPMRALYDRHWPGWHHTPELLMHVDRVPSPDIWEAHLLAKQALIHFVQATGGPLLDIDVPIIGLARRMTAYKRANLLFSSLERLKDIANFHPFQVVLAGKAHPHDVEGKRMIEQLHQHAAALGETVKVVFLSDYDMDMALRMVSGSDIWLNTPMPPLEACGTSGMKAAFNGVPNLSVLDGWWVEGCIEGVTGWAIGGTEGQATDEAHAASLYDKLENIVLPLWYGNREGWIAVMKGAIARNANYFNSQRMMRQYAAEAYLL